MRNGKLWLAAIMAVALAAPALAQDDDTAMQAMQARVRDQEARIRTLEDAQAGATSAAATREEVRAIVREILAEEGAGAADPLTFRAFWKDGLNFATADKQFTMAIGGRAQWDWVWIDGGEALEESLGDLEDGTEFRRLRLAATAVVYGNVEFKLEVDFAGGETTVKDVYIRLMKIPFVGNFYAGHFNEPFSLDVLTSDNYNTFMERALPTIFAAERNSGFMIANAWPVMDEVERLTAAIGLFRDTDDFGEGVSDGGYHMTSRVTFLPWYENKGERLFHVGAAYSFRSPEDSVRWRQRPEIHLSPRFVDTGSFAADHVNVLGGEAAMVFGPFHMQGEYIAACNDLADDGNAYMQGFYVQAGYFLTGEVRPYKPGSAVFDRVRPKQNFDIANGGLGAWELAARYSWLDLTDGALEGGEMQDVTFGINWYLDPNVRIMWNYIRSCIEDDDAADILGMRFQFMF